MLKKKYYYYYNDNSPDFYSHPILLFHSIWFCLLCFILSILCLNLLQTALIVACLVVVFFFFVFLDFLERTLSSLSHKVLVLVGVLIS
jgi:hypothetical protein